MWSLAKVLLHLFPSPFESFLTNEKSIFENGVLRFELPLTKTPVAFVFCYGVKMTKILFFFLKQHNWYEGLLLSKQLYVVV